VTANDYMSQIYSATGTKLIDGHPLYSGIDGHIRLAHEIGAALPDFTPSEQQTILSASYSAVYVRACNLRPILDARGWIREIINGRIWR
jgi:hypothetical protein